LNGRVPSDGIVARCMTVLLTAALAGCATLPADRGLGDLQKLVADHGGPALPTPDATQNAWINELLQRPLAAHDAVRIALVNNPRIRGEYARLGIASADVYDAGRLSNPRFSTAVLNSNASGAADQVTFGLAQSFSDLLLLRARSRLASGEFARAKQQTAQAILNFVGDVEVAYFTHAGAQQVAAMRAKIAAAAEASAELAARLFDAGNFSARELAQEQSTASMAGLSALQATLDERAAHAKVNEILGLAVDSPAWQAASVLPVPLVPEDALAELLPLAAQSRLDLAAQRSAVALLAESLKLTRRYRYFAAVEVGVETERGTDRSRITGPTLSLELPIFNQGAGKVARAEGLLAEAESTLAALELTVANKVTLAAESVRAARARAELLRTQLIPQREEVVKATQQEVNYMLAGQFTLLLVKQQAYDAYQMYLETLRDYWIARAELTREVGARLPSEALRSAPASRAIEAAPTHQLELNHDHAP
jgi:outer membrane protein, heavy metal efflux system